MASNVSRTLLSLVAYLQNINTCYVICGALMCCVLLGKDKVVTSA